LKKPWLAFTLSFLLPGAGLVYLGKWKWGIINLVSVLGIGVVMTFLLPDDMFEKIINPVAAGLGVASGGLATSVAKEMNMRSTVSGQEKTE
jgi:hypothetical protein